MVFTEQQLQVKKLVDVQQDIEIERLEQEVDEGTVDNAELDDELGDMDFGGGNLGGGVCLGVGNSAKIAIGSEGNQRVDTKR